MTVEKLVKVLSNPVIPRDWLVAIQTPDGYAEVRRFSRREITTEVPGQEEDDVLKLLVIGH